MKKADPWYFAVNDRPGKVVMMSDGAIDVITLDPDTGEFIRDLDRLTIYFEGGRDVDSLTEEQFDARVEKYRAWLKGE